MGNGRNLVGTVWIDAAFGRNGHEVVNASHRTIKAEVVGKYEVGTKDNVAVDFIRINPRESGFDALLRFVCYTMRNESIKRVS